MIRQSIDMLSRANALRREYRLGNTASRNGASIDTTSRHQVVISRSRQLSHQYYWLFDVAKSQPVPVPGYRAAILWLSPPCGEETRERQREGPPGAERLLSGAEGLGVRFRLPR